MADEEKPIGPGNPPLATRFKPGKSGNPNGAKRHHKIRRSLLRYQGKALNAFRRKVVAGEQWAVTLWLAYTHGKPVDQLQLLGENGQGLSVHVEIVRTIEGEVVNGNPRSEAPGAEPH